MKNSIDMQKVDSVMKLVILIIVSLVICAIYASEKNGGPIHVVQNAFSTVISPIQQVGISAKSGLEKLSDRIYEDIGDADTITGLKAENAKLKKQLIADEKYKQEAQRLREMLDLKDQYDAEGIGAHVIGMSANAWNQTITIGVGSEEGISAGLTVLGSNGVIGQVDSVNLFSSTVRLLSDPNSGVAVNLMHGQEYEDCILKGSLDGVLYLKGLDTNKNVSAGDVVVTSGLGGSFVGGLLIGNVSQIISADSGVNRKIVVNPIEKSSTLTDVFVIKEIR